MSEKTEEELREEKQQFLCREIIENSYNTEEFTGFFLEKMNSCDIDAVSLEELSRIVKEFKCQFNGSEEDQSVYTILCVVPPPTELSSAEDPSITVTDSEFVPGGIFSSNYFLHSVRTSPLEWAVKRQFSEFTWLRELLVTCYPCVCFPPLPVKYSRTRGDCQMKHEKLLTRFMNSLLTVPELQRSEILMHFLSEEQLSQYRRSCKGIKKPERVNATLRVSGQQNCSLADRTLRYEQLTEYAALSEALKLKLKRQSQTLIANLSSLSAGIGKFASTVEQFGSLQRSIQNNEKSQLLYTNLHHTMQEYSDHQSEKLQTINEFFTIFFKYSYSESRELKLFLKQRDSLANTSKKNEAANEFYGLYNQMAETESRRIIQENLKESAQNFLCFAKTEMTHTRKLQVIWETLKTELQQLSIDE